jgi:hypothetical protein
MNTLTRTDPHIEQRISYTTLSGLFLSLFAAFAVREQQHKQHTETHAFDLVLLGTATYRLGRLIAYDKVAEPYREPFTETVPDSSGMGKTVVPKKQSRGVRRAIGELLSCPICTGTWVAAALTYSLHQFPRPTRMFLMMMSAVGMAELLNAATEALKWTGRAEREESSAVHAQRERL